MNHETARNLLGIGSTASHSEIETAWQHRQDEVLARLKRASSSADRQQCMNDLEALQAARDLLLNAAEPSSQRGAAAGAGLSHTKLADLPGGDAFDTASGTGGNRAQILSLKAGDRLSGRFEIQQQIGAGGMGVVYRALDTNRDEAIALKVMQPGLLSNDAAKQRFMSEAKIAIGLSHPHIVKTYDVQKDGAYLYLTMELLQGLSLREAMIQRKQAGREWALDEVIGIATSLSDALSYAHKLTIHRDLKPENVWLTKDGQAKLMDFGIAKLLSGSQLTQTSTVMGTAYYMAPEQLQGARDIDHRADQYAVAVMIYELLTGRVPIGALKSINDLREDVGKSLSDIIMRALSPQPEERFDNMAVFAEQLRDALKRNVVKAKKPVNKSTGGGGSTKLIAGAVALVLLAGGAVFYSKQPSAPAPNPAPAVPDVAGAKQPEPVKVEMKPVEPPKVEALKAQTVPAFNSTEIAMLSIPAGNFEMGSKNGEPDEKLVHTVTISQPFEMGKYEVTQGQWKAVMGKNPSEYKKCGDNCPVENVSWDDVQAFIKKLNALTGKQYRLPTEAEWEYACRGGGTGKYCGGDDLGSVGWYDGNSGGKTHQVGQKKANGYGLFDMSGNVEEWVQDFYSDSYAGAPADGSARNSHGRGEFGSDRALRGGSWINKPLIVRAAIRSYIEPADRNSYFGFRVARTLP
jgi:formylglycine-generating enzyme required for sulfatase activity